MTLSRRTFLFSAGAAGFAWTSGAVPTSGKVLLRFGALSDSHVSVDPGTLEPLRRIFAWFARENVDAVCHAGDICEVGNFAELQSVADVWKAAFPDGRNAAGDPVRAIFAFGNHDYHAASYQRGKALTEQEKSECILCDKPRAWKLLTGEETFPGEVTSCTVKGHVFLTAHWGHESEIADWFAAHPDAGTRPIFHVRHPHPKGTCFGPWATGTEKGIETLKRHPNVFVLSGHSHINAGNDCGIWQGGYVSMGCGSARLTNIGSFDGAYDNTSTKKPQGRVWHTPLTRGKAWQASLVTVYERQIVVERRDFFYVREGEPLGEPWMLDFPFQHDAAKPYAVAAAALPPQFSSGAKITCRKTVGLRRPEKMEENQIVFSVSEPARSDGPHARPGFYRFDIRDASSGRMIASRSVIQEGWINAERRSSGRAVICAFAEDELPKGATVLVRVTPMNAAGREGRALESMPFPPLYLGRVRI